MILPTVKRFFAVVSVCAAGAGIAGGALDPRTAVSRSDIILQRPNRKAEEAMPLGNGQLGLAIWAADGLTIQVNREDTLPGRLSPGQVVLPGLERISSASDYSGRLKLYDGEFTAQGNGMTATVYVQPDADIAVVEVTGADPQTPQTAVVRLWPPRHPNIYAKNGTSILSETWMDSGVSGATGKIFGSLCAVTARGANSEVNTDGTLTARLSFRPDRTGSFRLLIAAPHWNGGDAVAAAHSALAAPENVSPSAHRSWWNKFWHRAGLLQLDSEDGSAEYMENLRAIYLFTAAAEKGEPFPGSQAGIADLFSSSADYHKWDPSAYWHYNLRMQVAANLGAGLFEENGPYFRLYRDNLPKIEQWTHERMNALPGACVPETMRFNGQGIENETWLKSPGLNCDAGSVPYYNARTISTGAEVSYWIWQQYLATDDRVFLAANYPIMAAAARFLLAYSRLGDDGRRHTSPSNAHEDQWDVKDPVTDICAMRTLFPELIEASRVLGRDFDLAQQARVALSQIPELPRTDLRTLKEQLPPEADAVGQDAIGESYQQAAPIHNTENLGLEPVWPYSLIGDTGPLHELAVRTFESRRNKMQNDWSFDPLQAARLGLAQEVKTTLIGLTSKYQEYPSGLAHFAGPEFYVEQIGVVTAALNEALVQDYDDVIRIAPAWPRDWDAIGTVSIRHKSKVTVEVRSSVIAPVAFDAGYEGNARFRNPWPGERVSVVESAQAVETTANGDFIEFSVKPGKRYMLGQKGSPQRLPGPRGTAGPSAGPRFLDRRSIGLGKMASN